MNCAAQIRIADYQVVSTVCCFWKNHSRNSWPHEPPQHVGSCAHPPPPRSSPAGDRRPTPITLCPHLCHTYVCVYVYLCIYVDWGIAQQSSTSTIKHPSLFESGTRIIPASHVHIYIYVHIYTHTCYIVLYLWSPNVCSGGNVLGVLPLGEIQHMWE